VTRPLPIVGTLPHLLTAATAQFALATLTAAATGSEPPTTNSPTTALGPEVAGLRILNTSTNETMVPVNSFLSYTLTLIGPDGKSVPASEFGERVLHPMFYSSQGMGLPPGQTYTFYAPITDMFQITNPGDYAVTVAMRLRGQVGTNGLAVPSAPLTLRISPPKSQRSKPPGPPPATRTNK
jgi:hypothetical protein